MKLRRLEIAALCAAALVLTATVVLCFQKDSPARLSLSPLQSAEQSAPPIQGETELININTATAEELCTLPGIGEKLALRIIAFREENGGFANISDIIDVAGIGKVSYEKLAGLITV